MSKVENIYNQSVQTSQNLANGEWPAFLKTAAWNYRYSFPNQVLIYAQRPDATACASMADWNNKLHRRVNAGAAGIALLEDSGDNLRLSYIFDVSDTRSPSGAQAPIWTMTQAKEEDVRIALADAYLPGSHPYRDDVMAHQPTNFYYEVAYHLCEELANSSVQDLLAVKESCEALQNLSDAEVEWEFRTLLQTSVVSILMQRCGLEPDVDPTVWESARRYQDLSAMAILGQTTQNIARQGLEVARYAVRKWDKEHREEKKNEQEHYVPEGRSVQNSGSEHSGAEASEPVRETSQAVSEGTQTQPVHADDAVRGSDGAPSQHRDSDGATGDRPDAGPSEEEPGTPEAGQQPDLDTAYGSSSEAGRRDDPAGDDLRLTDESGEPLPEASEEGLDPGFPSVAEQASIVDASSSEMYLTQDEIEFILSQVIEDRGVDENLLSVFLDEPNSQEAINALQEAYRDTNEIFRIDFSDKVAAVSGTDQGIEVGRRGERVLIPWQDFAVYFQKQVNDRRFEKEQEVIRQNPMSSDELQEGQILHLSGTPYRVTAITESTVSLQDVAHPIFTQALNKNILDILLQPKNPEIRENPIQEREEEVPSENTPEELPEIPVEEEVSFEDTPIEEFIDNVLMDGSGFEDGKLRIQHHYQEAHSISETAEFLKHEYGIGGGDVVLGNGNSIWRSEDSKGLSIQRHVGSSDRILLTWSEVAKRIDQMIKEDRYLIPEEKARYEATYDSYPQPVDNQIHNPEPLIDHPELIARNVSHNARQDKVILADMLMHFVSYHNTYAGLMPSLSAQDANSYLQQRESLENMAASESVEENRKHIQEAVDFFNRWFVPFSEDTWESIQKEMNQVLNAAETSLQNWEQLGIIDPERPEAGPEAISEPVEITADYTAESFHVGDFYEDAYGRGVITSISPEAFDGNHKAMFSFADPDAPEGSRAAQGFITLIESAIEKLQAGEATLTPGDIWRSQRATQETEPAPTPEEPSLFDFTYDEPAAPEKEPVLSEPVPVNAVPSITPSERINYHIGIEEENLGGPKARFQNNIAAIRLLKNLEAEGRLATEEEQKTLAKYVGWGGLSQAFDSENSSWSQEYNELKELLTDKEYASARESTLTAFYTPPAVTEAIYDGLRQLGFSRGNILDPCCGTGHFFGMLPEDMNQSKLYGVELDDISGRISRQLYQNANIVIEGYEKTALPDAMFDVAVGNVPFGNFQLADRRYDREHFLIHDYFFAKTLDKVRPGGVIAFVTSKGTMDKENESVRKYIAQRADLLGAIRLPDNTFKNNAGTEVVSDILFLRKRERPGIEDPYWVGLDRQYLGYEQAREGIWGPPINAYFVENPEMVLGDLVEVSGPHGPVISCKAREGEDLRTQLKQAVKNIEGSIGKLAIDLDALDNPNEPSNSIPADPNVRNFSYTVVNGDVYFREDSLMFRCEMNKTAEKRVKGMVNLRNITRDLIEAQMEGAPDAHVEALQDLLNTAYDEFSKKHGLINSTANSRAFSDDSSYYLLCSLENLDEEGNFVSKADIFTKRTIGQHKTPDHVETAQEALAVSLGELAKVDLGYMSALSDISEEKLVSDLKGLIFPVPGTDRYEISHVYLSGNVREKLQEAKEAAEADPRFLENVAHLEKSLPEPLEASDISVRLGTTWIPPEYYKDFLIQTLKLPEYCQRYLDVTFEPYTCSWALSGKNIVPYSTMRSSTYGTSRMDALDIFERTLNLRDVQVYDTKTGPNGETHRVLNGEETLAAQEKQQQMKDAFSEWIWKDPDRREHLCNLYNEKFNSIVPPSFSPDLVQFHGLNPMIELASHQKESVARILYSGNTLLAHTVGAGKTWTMTAAAMESKYLGLCNKSLIVVPNHLIGQWAAAIYEAYPQANVLASTEKDFEPANRKKFCSRIATGDYDIVVIGHSHFEKIPLSPERQEATIQKEIDDIMASISQLKAANGERFSIKKLEAARKSLQTKLDKLNNSKKRDDVITFEELGVDRLFVDESHNYKNLFVNTKMHNVAGISQTDSQKASDMFVKSRYIDEITGGKGIIHGTGSPLSNTMAELYTTQRYLQYDALQKMGLGSFDAWASTFGETVVALELAPEGNGYRPRTRFAKFFNLPELMNMYKQVADIRTKDMLDLPVPAVEYQVEVLKPSEEQKAIVQSFGERADKIRKGGINNRDDNMLCVTNDGRKVALDQRLIDPSLPDNPNSKTAACAESIWGFYQKGEAEKLTQLVFCDLSTPKKGEFNVYDDLKEKLVAKGIPADEIRFIHEANTVPQKEALFSKVRSGAVRVLMGSTNKMGTGTNVQDRLIAGHDLDAPWRPSDLEQRSGRVIRRGNNNDKVFMRRYVTEGTFDAYMYQLLEIKQRFIDQVFSSKNPARTIDDVDGAALDYAEIKALSSGDPRIKEKVALEMEITKLEVMKNRHFNEMYRLEHMMSKLPGEIKALQEQVAAIGKDFDKVCSRPSRTEEGKLIPASVKGFTYEKQEDAGNALIEAVKKNPHRGDWVTIGSLRGFEIQGILLESEDGKSFSIKMAISGQCRYSINASDSGQGLMTRLNNILDKTVEARLDSAKKKLAACESDLITTKAQLGKLFPDEELLQQKKAQLAKLDEELNLEAQEKQEGKGTEVSVEVNKPHEAAAKRSLSDIIAGAQRIADNAASNSQNRTPSYSR